jgi:hypothetical protein
MPQETIASSHSLIPPEPIPATALDFSKRMHRLMDGQPKDCATVAKALDGMDEMVDHIAAGLYHLASMLMGEGEDSVRLVETTIATAEVTVNHDPAQKRKSTRQALCVMALDTIVERHPGSLDPPERLESTATCIEGDDLDAAGVSGEELERMIAGPDRGRVRNWLESLPAVLRTVFVLRAVAGFTTAETAVLLAEHAGVRAAAWTTDAVRGTFHLGLCSLASQLIHASAAR